MWQPTWCFFRLHKPPSWGRRIWHGNSWLEQQRALMPAGFAVAGEEECSLEVCSFCCALSKEELAAWNNRHCGCHGWGLWGLLILIGNSIKMKANMLKPVWTMHRQKGAQGRQLRWPISCYLALINRKISLSDKLLYLHLCWCAEHLLQAWFQILEASRERTHLGKQKLNKSAGFCSQTNR